MRFGTEGTLSFLRGAKVDGCGLDFRSCFLRSSTAFINLILSGVIVVDLCEGRDLTLPRDTGLGLYSGISGIGGGLGRTEGVGAGAGTITGMCG